MSTAMTPTERVSALASETEQARVADVETHWWSFNADTATSEDVILAVHGFRGDHHGLTLFAAHWPEHRFVIPDLPGFGASSDLPGGNTDITAYAAWLSAFAERIRPARGRLIILGHSFGSIVVAAALAGGLDVDRAILVNPISAPALEGPRGVLTKAAIGYYRLGAVLPERLGRAWLSHPLIVRIMGNAMAKNPDRVIRQFVHDQHARYFSRFASLSGVLGAFRTSVSHHVAEYAADIAVPLLLIAAERDDITPVSAQERVAKLAPNASLAVIPAVGHLIHYETPAVAVEHMRAFVGRA